VTRTLLERHQGNRDAVCESLAYHALEAGEPAVALPWLERSIDKAVACGGEAVARLHRERARQVVDHLLASTSDPEERRQLEERAAALSRGQQKS
jgi:hypothetical protein